MLLHLSKDLITGGIDTTTHLVGNLFYDILTTPGTYERLRDDRSLVPIAVEECLRHRPVVNVLFRRPGRGPGVRGRHDPRRLDGRARVLVGQPRRDGVRVPGEVRPRPRRRRSSVSSGSAGACTSASVRRSPRLEGAHVLNAVLDRIPSMRLAPGFEYQRVKMFMMRGPVALDVEFDPTS